MSLHDFFNFRDFVKKIRQNVADNFALNFANFFCEMEVSKTSDLKNSIIEFYKLHHNKGKNNWSADNRDQMIRRIKSKIKEIDQNMVAGMFDNLKAKIHLANTNGLSSLL